MKNFDNHLINENSSLKEALGKLNLNENAEELILFAQTNDNKIVGSITDGDIRRALLKDYSLSSPIKNIMQRSFKYLIQGNFTIKQIDDYKANRIFIVPLLDHDNKLVKLINLNKKKSLLPIDAVLMAGGRGQRLSPLTDKTPKPLLKIAEKPVIEYNIDRLIDYGVENIFISINYLGEQIKQYFGNGSSKGVNIFYIEESKPLGTFGSLTLVSKYVHNDIIVMNSDLLTTIDFESFYRHYISNQSDLQIASIPYEVKIPYAILETENNVIHDFKEKPTKVYYANGGIYLLKSKLVETMPKNQFYNATDFMKYLINNKKHVLSYPLLNYWLDIGNPEDFERAQRDVKNLKL